MRERLADEITPKIVELSKVDEETRNAAAYSIDLDLGTWSKTHPDSDGTAWFKFTLDQVYCVNQVVNYNSNGTPSLTWTCSQTDCTKCEGRWCSDYSLTVSSEGAVPGNLPPATDCRYGNTVKMQYDTYAFSVCEISIAGKQVVGKIRALFHTVSATLVPIKAPLIVILLIYPNIMHATRIT